MREARWEDVHGYAVTVAARRFDDDDRRDECIAWFWRLWQLDTSAPLAAIARRAVCRVLAGELFAGRGRGKPRNAQDTTAYPSRLDHAGARPAKPAELIVEERELVGYILSRCLRRLERQWANGCLRGETLKATAIRLGCSRNALMRARARVRRRCN